MQKIVHISDIHFGKEDESIVNALLTKINEIAPNVIVVSGDLTQRAKHREYKKVKLFLSKLDFPKVVIPGNHDIPLYNLLGRVINPFRKFDYYFPNCNRYENEQVSIVGLNSVRNLRWKSGKLTIKDLEESSEELKVKKNAEKLKIVVMHHNLLHLPSNKNSESIFRTKLMQKWIFDNGIDLILFGHDHKSTIKPILFDHDNIFDFILIQAASATSTRRRGNENSFNLIMLENSFMQISIETYEQHKYKTSSRIKFNKQLIGWEKTE
ncbi:MAG: metallophosphoesterase [Bacteroidota bacterium]